MKATHKMPSGMGGIFTVIILTETNTHYLVKIVNDQSDWDGKYQKVEKNLVKPL